MLATTWSARTAAHWIYEVQLERGARHWPLAQAPVYNLASYQVHPLAEMRGPTPIGTPQPE